MAFLDKTGLERLWLHILSKTNQTLASAKQYADDIKNDLLNGAGGAYDTLKELGDLIDENADAIDAIERLADTKSDKGHIHDDRYYTEAEVDDALKFVKEASGEVIAVNDSAEQNLVGLKLYGKTTQTTTTGKNLINVQVESGSQGGVSYRNENGVVIVNGTSTSTVYIWLGNAITLSPGTYTISGKPDGFQTSQCAVYDDNHHLSAEGTTTLTDSADIRPYIVIHPGVTFNNAVFKPQLELGSTATAYEPYTGGAPSPNPNYPQPLVNAGDSGSIGVKASGKNLFDFDNWKTSYSPARANVTCGQESVTITALENDAYAVAGTKVNVVGGKTYTISFDVSDNNIFKLNHLFKNGIVDDSLHVHYATRYTFTADDDAKFYTVRFGVPEAGNTVTFSNIMFNEGSTALPYEPYKDGGSMTASTPNGLPGIPVSSGGNYTDETGQQWVCDEKDYERGVYMQRIARYYLDGSVPPGMHDQNGYMRFVWGGTGFDYIPLDYLRPDMQMCNRFVPSLAPLQGNDVSGTIATYSPGGIYLRYDGATSVEEMVAYLAENPIEYMYIMATPIETPIDPTELTAYRAMTSQKPTTTVYNDAGAGMTVEYADIKIDDIEKALNLPEIDSTLTLSNAAAEAQVVGKEL